MQELRKINSMQLYYLWRNLAISLLCVGVVMGGAHVLPFYMAPVLSLFLCGVLYTMIWNNSVADNKGSMIVVETMLYSLLCYTFISILFVVVQVLGLYHFPNEIIFFNDLYLTSLELVLTTFAESLYVFVISKSLSLH